MVAGIQRKLNGSFAQVKLTSVPKKTTPLMNADARSASLLIAHGAKCDARDDRGDTPLMKAVGRNDVAVINLLLDRGADINAPDKAGRTPLMFACIQIDPTLTDLLIARGADVNVADNEGTTALM